MKRPLLVVLAAVLVYLNSLPGALFWDTEVLILDNAWLRSFRFLPKLLTSCITCGGGELNNYWRPVPAALLLLEYQLWGPSPLGYHAVNLLIHALNAGLLYFLVRDIASDEKTAFWAALLFALHPVQNETLNYVDHMEGMLAFSFGVCALLANLQGRRVLSLLSWATCLLCKEEGVVFFPILFAMEALGSEGAWRDRAKRFAPHAALLAVYLILHATIFNFLKLPLAELGAQKGAYAPIGLRLLTFAKAFAVYLRLLLLPTGLHFDRDIPPALSWLDPWAWGAAALGTTTMALLWRWSGRDPVPKLGLLWFFAGLLPYCGLVPFNNILAEHFLYIPFAGLAMTAATLARRLPLSPPTGSALAGALVAFYAGQDLHRNRDWQKPERIYRTTLAGNPKSYRAANNLGVEYFRAGSIGEAELAFKLSLAANPIYHPALNNLGAVEEARGRLQQALELYLRSAAAGPDYALARKNAAGIWLKSGRFAEAERLAGEALRLHPSYAAAWEILGASLFHQGRRPEAVAAFRKALEIQPSPQAEANLRAVLSAPPAARK